MYSFYFILPVIHAQSQQDSTKEEHIKKGFSFGILPALSYDSDLGFLYGVIANVYHFGDGSNYSKLQSFFKNVGMV